MTEARISQFIDQLANTQVPRDTVNQYNHSNSHNAIRRHNLARYLSQMLELQPKTLLVAEAPGYKGMRLTGVPFSSRAFIRDGIDGVPIFGEVNGYQAPIDEDNPSEREQTATIVWEVLRDVRPLPLSWNTSPFHPHRQGELLSNRKPRKPELDIGQEFLLEIMDMYPFETFIAIGNTADGVLSKLGIDHHKVRHPAQGGKNDFVRGMQDILR